MTKESNQSWAVRQLQEKQKELDRLPQKKDFDEVTLSRIKAFLGPWPRALEAAGLKTPPAPKAKTPHPRKTRKRRIKSEIYI